MDASIVGRTYPSLPPYAVTADAVGAFVAATGAVYDGGPAPATFLITPAFAATLAFLEAERLDLARIVHGEQRFVHARTIQPGDRLTLTLQVASLRSIGGNEIVGTALTAVDDTGELVATGTATLVHRGGEAA